MDHRIHLAASSDSKVTPGLSASIAIGEDFEDRPLDITANDECRRITKQTFQKHWNESFDSFQKARLHGGEYYIERSESGNRITFHAFLLDVDWFRKLLIINYFPMQNLSKMLPSTSSVVISPKMVPRLRMAERRSSARRSGVRPVERPVRTASRSRRAAVRAS